MSTEWQEFGLEKVGCSGVISAEVDVSGAVPGHGPVRSAGGVFEPVNLRVLGQVHTMGDFVEAEPLVLQRLEAALPRAVLSW